MSVKVKTGDTVRVIAGKDKGKEGKILSVNASENRVIVEGVNMIKKHEKPNGRNQNGGIVTKEAPIDLSNVMYLHKGQPTRIGYKMDGDKKVRIAKSNGDVLD